MSPARLALAAGVVLCLCVLAYLAQVAKRKRALTAYGGLFAVGVATVGVLLVNVGVDGLRVLHP